MRTPSVVVAALLLLSGCVDPTPSSEAEHSFGGSFTEQATQVQIQDFGDRMRAHGGDVVVMESFPAQFRVDGFGKTGCEAARTEANRLDYVASASVCRPVVRSTNGDEPTHATHAG